MTIVTVVFEDEKYNYTTQVSPDTTFEQAKKYFVGQWFNMSSGEPLLYADDIEDMQQCKAIIYE